ncbi:MAG: hypothetical protein M0038_13430 [Pseudomonadota bacterium]|jgi:hypothetical protein|nr:hypothetical protein [Pseudomonadota bacterium]
MVSTGEDNAAEQLLDGLAVAFSATDFALTREPGSLLAKQGSISTRIWMVSGEESDSPLGPVKCVLQIRSDLPAEMAGMILAKPEAPEFMNRMATLGALTLDGDRWFVGARITILESDNAWNIQAPLILMSVIAARESLLGATGRALSGHTMEEHSSEWVESDFDRVEDFFSARCVCSRGNLGFVAELPLEPGAICAMAGDNRTALWSIKGDEPHPELGGGLFCKLELPHQLSDGSRLHEVLQQLNQLEMLPHALPPHFGAWCVGKLGNNPAYVSFLPNALHDAARGIAVNMTAWAWGRAKWANATLASMGIC